MNKLKRLTFFSFALLFALCAFYGVRQALRARESAYAQTALSQEEENDEKGMNRAIIIADIVIGAAACVGTSVAIVYAYRRYKQ